MHGERLAEPNQLVLPLGISTRQSTDAVAIEDRWIAAALHFIRENACRGINVDIVTQNIDVPRSTLDRQLRKYLGRTPQEEIRHVQITRARELLLTTELPAEHIADLSILSSCMLCSNGSVARHPESFLVRPVLEESYTRR